MSSPLRLSKPWLPLSFVASAGGFFPADSGKSVYDANAAFILPATPPEIARLGAQLDRLTQASRDEVHNALGDSRFAYLDSALRARASRDFETLKSLHSGSAQ
jgi:hypothetical protein